MTVKELWEFINESVEFVADWVSDFALDFLNIFFHKVSWMDSNVLIVASVLVAYGFLALWILGSTPVQYVLSADFRSEWKAKKAQRIRDEEIARGEDTCEGQGHDPVRDLRPWTTSRRARSHLEIKV